MKKLLAIVLAVLMIAAMTPMVMAADSTVYVSVVADGKLLLAAKPVTVSSLTVEAAVKAAHTAYYSGGTSGYVAGIDKTYNMYLVTKCWGVAATPYFVINNAPLGSDAKAVNTVDKAPIKAGDNIIIVTSSDTKNPAKPVSLTATVSGSSATITATSWTLDFTSWSYKSAPLAKASVVDSAGASLGTTDAKGAATVTIPADGVIAIAGTAAIYVATSAAAPSTTPATPATPSTETAVPSAQKVTVNGTATAFDAYNINGNNYFKLRDLASVLSGSEKQFSVSITADTKKIDLATGKAYAPVGGEMGKGDGSSKSAVLSAWTVYVDGKQVSLTAYNIGGNNYFKLRDLGSAINFGVTFDSATNTIKVDTKSAYVAG